MVENEREVCEMDCNVLLNDLWISCGRSRRFLGDGPQAKLRCLHSLCTRDIVCSKTRFLLRCFLAKNEWFLTRFLSSILLLRIAPKDLWRNSGFLPRYVKEPTSSNKGILLHSIQNASSHLHFNFFSENKVRTSCLNKAKLLSCSQSITYQLGSWRSWPLCNFRDNILPTLALVHSFCTLQTER